MIKVGSIVEWNNPYIETKLKGKIVEIKADFSTAKQEWYPMLSVAVIDEVPNTVFTTGKIIAISGISSVLKNINFEIVG